MNYTVIENALTAEELTVVNTVILGYDYPWYYYDNDTDNGEGFPFMCHTLMQRAEGGAPMEGTANSGSYKFFRAIFDRLCPDRTLLRAALNLTFHNPAAHANIHVDHPFPHHNLIVYLSETDAGTLLFDNDDKQIDRIPAQYNTAVQFDGIKHAQEMCAPGQTRLVAVFTYI